MAVVWNKVARDEAKTRRKGIKLARGRSCLSKRPTSDAAASVIHAAGRGDGV